MGFPTDSVVKNPPANAGDGGFSPSMGKIPWRRKWHYTQYSCLNNSMDRGAGKGGCKVRHNLMPTQQTTTVFMYSYEKLTH